MQVTRNAAASIAQVIGSSIILFFLYRMVVVTLGAEGLGVWSVVLATTSASRIGELGLSASVTRFVAKHRANENQQTAAETIQTAAISIAAFMGVALIVAYPALTALFGILFDESAYSDAITILPLALVSLFLTAVAAVFQSGLDGYSRYDLRAALVLASQSAALVLAFLLTPSLGLIGLAWAQVLQGILLIAGGWVLIKQVVPGIPKIPSQWRRERFREMLGYGLKFQIGAIASLLFEPLTKSILAKFGGLASAGYYEMARQFVSKARQLIISANQVLVPLAAALSETEPRALGPLYRANLRLLTYIVFPLFGVVAAWAPLVSELWIGYYEQEFVFFVGILAFAWGLNTFSGPAYFANAGTGQIAWNTAAHVGMGLANLLLASMLGLYFGAAGVAWATLVSLVFGSAIVVYGFHRSYRIDIHSFLTRDVLMLTCIAISVVATDHMIYALLRPSTMAVRFVACISLPTIAFIAVYWAHPNRSEILAQFQSILSGGGAHSD